MDGRDSVFKNRLLRVVWPGNVRVTFTCEPSYQQLESEAGISCWQQQVSEKCRLQKSASPNEQITMRWLLWAFALCISVAVMCNFFGDDVISHLQCCAALGSFCYCGSADSAICLMYTTAFYCYRYHCIHCLFTHLFYFGELMQRVFHSTLHGQIDWLACGFGAFQLICT